MAYFTTEVIICRSTDELVPLIGQQTVGYLNRIRGLSNPEDIENWHQFCKTHENKKLRGMRIDGTTMRLDDAHAAPFRLVQK
jgi:hypothetical protein